MDSIRRCPLMSRSRRTVQTCLSFRSTVEIAADDSPQAGEANHERDKEPTCFRIGQHDPAPAECDANTRAEHAAHDELPFRHRERDRCRLVKSVDIHVISFINLPGQGYGDDPSCFGLFFSRIFIGARNNLLTFIENKINYPIPNKRS